jgi:prevent-host-death family protein
MAKQVNLYDAKTHLSELVERAAGGEEIVIAKAGLPGAWLGPRARPWMPRRPGAWTGGGVIGPYLMLHSPRKFSPLSKARRSEAPD